MGDESVAALIGDESVAALMGDESVGVGSGFHWGFWTVLRWPARESYAFSLPGALFVSLWFGVACSSASASRALGGGCVELVDEFELVVDMAV